MSDLYISWDDYNKKTEQLAKAVYNDGWEFNQVVCIANPSPQLRFHNF